MPTVDTWLQGARADAERQGHADAQPVLDALAQAATTLRQAVWSADASGRSASDTPRRSGTTSTGRA